MNQPSQHENTPPEPEQHGPEPIEISKLLGSELDALFVRSWQSSQGGEEELEYLNDPELREQAKGDMARLNELIDLRRAEDKLKQEPDNTELQETVKNLRAAVESYDT